MQEGRQLMIWQTDVFSVLGISFFAWCSLCITWFDPHFCKRPGKCISLCNVSVESFNIGIYSKCLDILVPLLLFLVLLSSYMWKTMSLNRKTVSKVCVSQSSRTSRSWVAWRPHMDSTESLFQTHQPLVIKPEMEEHKAKMLPTTTLGNSIYILYILIYEWFLWPGSEDTCNLFSAFAFVFLNRKTKDKI